MTTNSDALKQLLQNMFADCELGLTPHRHYNGADWYSCPSCYATIDDYGYLLSTGSLFHSGAYGAIEHKKDCKLVELFILAHKPDGE